MAPALEKERLFLIGGDQHWLLEEDPVELILDRWLACVRRGNGSGKTVGTGFEESWQRIWALFYSHWEPLDSTTEECHPQTCVSEDQIDAGNVRHHPHLYSVLCLLKGFHSCWLISSSQCLHRWDVFYFHVWQRGKIVWEIKWFLYTNDLIGECWDSELDQELLDSNLLLILEVKSLLRSLLLWAGLEVMSTN